MTRLHSTHFTRALALVVLAGCASQAPAPPAAVPAQAETEETVLLGELDREEIEAGLPERWMEALAMAEPDMATAAGLTDVQPADLTIYLGSWCSDSRREVTRFWSALDGLGDLPFNVRYVAVDRSKTEPEGLLEGIDLRYVPTFVVERDGREIGRVIESAPEGIESELLSILEGSKRGWITGRDDLPASGSQR